MNKYTEIRDGVYVRDDIKFQNIDSLILDCDGTLINTNRSYNACIKHTAGFILERLLGKGWCEFVTDDLILSFRLTGGFNNDVDTTYACIISAIASNSNDIEEARRFAFKVAKYADERGIASIERILNVKGKEYPSIYSILNVFDEFFYGRELFMRIYGREPQFNKGKGFIEEDKVVITEECISILSNIFKGKVSIVSGRSRIATEYSLKKLLRYFDLESSVFIEDEERAIMKNKSTLKVGKPEPYSLLKSMEKMNVREAISVGDSAEDLIMCRRASSISNFSILFCGVYNTGIDKYKQFKMLMDMNADAMLDNVNLLPYILANPF